MSISDRPIRGGLAMVVRRRHAAGDSAEAIARTLRLRVGTVRAYLASVAARASRLEWLAGDDEAPELPALPFGDVAEVDQVVAGEPPAGRIGLTPPAGDWGSVHARPGRNGNAALSDDDAERMRAMRARGVSWRDLASIFGVSMATVGRILGGRTYRPIELESDLVVIIDPPAIVLNLDD